MDAIHYFDARRIKCSCHPYKHGEVIHVNGVLMNLCWSWVCLRCFQAHVSFFELQGDRLVQVHDESFVCIADLPEVLQFDWADWDDDGHLIYWDRRMEYEDNYAIRALRKKLELPDLDEDLSGMFLRRDIFPNAIPF